MVKSVRTWTGVVLFVYITSHLLNHALGLVSLEAMEAGRAVFIAVWRNPLGTVVLYGSMVAHMMLALWALYSRRTLRMSLGDAAQLVLGLLIPVLLIEHVLGTRLAHELFDIEDNYIYVLLNLWVFAPEKGVLQTATLLVAWLHGCLGLHYWLRLKPGYERFTPLLYAAALLVPVFALLGFAQAGRQIVELAQDGAWVKTTLAALNVPQGAALKEAVASIAGWTLGYRVGVIAMVVAILLARLGRRWWLRRRMVRLTYPMGRVVESLPGITVLEASRRAGVPHASVCGGRGRCSTCRVRVGAGSQDLPPPTPEEQRVLDRVGAPPNVRLACQIRPTAALEVTPLLMPTATLADARGRPGYVHGQERKIAVLFADIRAFTQYSENKLPFDVVFVLNRYFSAMGQAIEEAGGRVDKFIGDGVMALFGVEGGRAQACRGALSAARYMSRRLAELNESLAHDLDEPLIIGIGVHFGTVIIGEMGYAKATSLTAIGDTVNTASRLETLTKDHGVQLVVSDAVAERGGVDLSTFPMENVSIRGRREKLAVRLVDDAGRLPDTTGGA